MDATLPRVYVMMATYNGADHLIEQIESILYQQDVAVTLEISDDRSTDATPAICRAYAERHPNVRFNVNAEQKRASRNFMDMVFAVDARDYDYFAFADQDDLWLPEKLSMGVKALKRAEAAGDSPYGYLYYSDYYNYNVVTEQQANSPFQLYRSHAYDFAAEMVVNWALGCTMVFDRPLCELLQRYDATAYPRYHDSWVHLVALTCAKTVPDWDRAFIVHKVTGANQSGRIDFGAVSLKRVAYLVRNVFKKREHHVAVTARNLLAGYGELLRPEDRALVEELAVMDTDAAVRWRLLFDKRLWVPGALETLSLKARIALNYL